MLLLKRFMNDLLIIANTHKYIFLIIIIININYYYFNFYYSTLRSESNENRLTFTLDSIVSNY